MFSDLVALLSSQAAPALIFAWVLYQLYWPSWMHPSEPKFRYLLKSLHDDVDALHELLVNTIQVIRAMAKAQNDDETLDLERIDDYLEENGVDPYDEFIDDQLPDTRFQHNDD